MLRSWEILFPWPLRWVITVIVILMRLPNGYGIDDPAEMQDFGL